MSGSAYKRKRRKRLFDRHPFCYWCGVILIEDYSEGTRLDNAATLDHLRSKFWGKRPNVFGKERTMVLACNKCNLERSRKEQDFIRKWMPWKLWIMGKSFPWPLRFLNKLLRSKRS